jgi:hypothetical protein
MKKQIIIVSALVLCILGCQKTFFSVNDSVLKEPALEAQKIANPIAILDARSVYEQVLSEIPTPESDSINPFDLLPQWGAAGNFNFVDTTDSYLSVPTSKFVGGGYSRLIFMRQNGKLTYFVAYFRGDAEYIHRKNGICEMSDFCGYIYYKNKQGAFFVGFKLQNGQIVEVLTPNPNPAPRPENEQDPVAWDNGLMGEVVVTATAPSNNGPIFSNFLFGSDWGTNGFNLGNLMNAGGSSTSGGSSSSSTSMNGTANPVINSDIPVCPLSFQDRPVSMERPNGTRTLTDTTLLTAGLKDLTIQFTYTDMQGLEKTVDATISYLYISMPNNCSESFGVMASSAIRNAITTTQNAISGGRTVGSTAAKIKFHEKLNNALWAQDLNNCTPYAGATRSGAHFYNYAQAFEEIVNKNTAFTNYTTCR